MDPEELLKEQQKSFYDLLPLPHRASVRDLIAQRKKEKVIEDEQAELIREKERYTKKLSSNLIG